MIKRMFLAIAVALLLAACSSVKLDDVPVEDKSASTVPAQPGAGGGQSSVAPVVTDSAVGTAAGPANVARVIFFDYDSYVIKPEFQSLVEA
jgi:peptidoglycan-associated lipoprotein